MLEATKLKVMAERPPLMARPLYGISQKSASWFKSYESGDTQTDRQTDW
jgi:hypothetical protein